MIFFSCYFLVFLPPDIDFQPSQKKSCTSVINCSHFVMANHSLLFCVYKHFAFYFWLNRSFITMLYLKIRHVFFQNSLNIESKFEVRKYQMYNIISAIYLENLMMVSSKCTDLKLFLTITFIS